MKLVDVNAELAKSAIQTQLGKLEIEIITGATLNLDSDNVKCSIALMSSNGIDYKHKDISLGMLASKANNGKIARYGLQTVYTLNLAVLGRSQELQSGEFWQIEIDGTKVGDATTIIMYGTPAAKEGFLSRKSATNQILAGQQGAEVNIDSAYAWGIESVQNIESVILTSDSGNVREYSKLELVRMFLAENNASAINADTSTRVMTSAVKYVVFDAVGESEVVVNTTSGGSVNIVKFFVK